MIFISKLWIAVAAIMLCPFLFAQQQPPQQEQQVQQVSENKIAGKEGEAKAGPKIPAKDKQLEPAIELINQVTGWDEFPYGSATQLMLAMPAEMSSEKLGLFSQAVNSFKNHDHNRKIQMGDGSLTNMVVRFGSKMPAKVVLEAIDEILSQAKKS